MGNHTRQRYPCSFPPRPNRLDSHRALALPSNIPNTGRNMWHRIPPWTWPGMDPADLPFGPPPSRLSWLQERKKKMLHLL